MASSQTQNLQLIEYGAGSDNFLRTDYNGNLTKIDEFAGKTKDDIETLEEGLAYIVGNTNTTGLTLAVGQFVYVKGHSTIAEGLRKVTASISANGSITTSNTDACSEGGLNALNNNVTPLNKAIFGYNEIYGSASINDLNNAEIGYWYKCYGSASNMPKYEEGMLFTIGKSNGTEKFQFFAGQTVIATRYYGGGSWSAWKNTAIS